MSTPSGKLGDIGDGMTYGLGSSTPTEMVQPTNVMERHS